MLSGEQEQEQAGEHAHTHAIIATPHLQTMMHTQVGPTEKLHFMCQSETVVQTTSLIMQVSESRKGSINVPFPHKRAGTVHYLRIRLFPEHFTVAIDVYCKVASDVEPCGGGLTASKLLPKRCAKVANLKLLEQNITIRNRKSAVIIIL